MTQNCIGLDRSKLKYNGIIFPILHYNVNSHKMIKAISNECDGNIYYLIRNLNKTCQRKDFRILY